MTASLRNQNCCAAARNRGSQMRGRLINPVRGSSTAAVNIMLEKFVQSKFGEVDALIAKARERLEAQEREGNDQDTVNKMRHGIARLQAYRSFIGKMN